MDSKLANRLYYTILRIFKVNSLYIIGNGFDLHHGIKSSYEDFEDFLIDYDIDVLEKLEEYFNSKSLWSEFEETLAELDTEQIVDECIKYLEPYDAEPWSDSYHHDYQYEIERRIDLITKELKNLFTKWVLQLEKPSNYTDKLIEINRRGLFISFNYTDTLESLYGVSPQNILYIHNKAIDKNSILILGHGRDPESNKKIINNSTTDEDDIGSEDIRVIEANKILDSYFEKTYKSTKNIIKQNQNFFKSLEKVKDIYVFGHSLHMVDRPYFEEIVRNIDKRKTKWYISTHNLDEISQRMDFMNQLGIESKLVEIDSITNFEIQQLSLFPKDK